MWKPFRALFGGGRVLQEELRAIRRRVEALESIPEPGRRVDIALERTALHAEVVAGLEARIVQLESDVDELHEQRKELVIAIAEGIERTDRAERRIKNTVRRARKELESRGYTDPGLEAEAYEFRESNGGGSEPTGLQPLPGPVAPVATDSSIRGVPVEALRHARGL